MIYELLCKKTTRFLPPSSTSVSDGSSGARGAPLCISPSDTSTGREGNIIKHGEIIGMYIEWCANPSLQYIFLAPVFVQALVQEIYVQLAVVHRWKTCYKSMFFCVKYTELSHFKYSELVLILMRKLGARGLCYVIKKNSMQSTCQKLKLYWCFSASQIDRLRQTQIMRFGKMMIE